MVIKLKKSKPEDEACDPTIYQSVIGILMFVMTAPWPAIAYAIEVLSWYNHDPGKEYKVALKSVFRYLNGTKEWLWL
jgi:hypothetical protein